MTSTQFDEAAYIARYPDLQDRSTMPSQPGLPYQEQLGWMFKSSDGTWHYGRTNGRELKRIQDNAYWHFQNFGKKEGRMGGATLPGTIFSPEFDAIAYAKRYPDVAGISYPGKNPYRGDPVGHYQNVGKLEGRVPGYEILNENSVAGLSTPGTTKYQDIAQTVEDQRKFEGQHKSPGTGEILPTATDTGIVDMTGKNNLLLIAGIGLAAVLIFRKKDKK